MKIEKIKIGYSTSIPIAMYGIKDGAWAEVEINTEGDPYDFDALFTALKEEVDATVRRKYPHLYVQPKTYDVVPDINIDWGEAGVNRPAEEENISLLDRINNSTNAKELKSWELLIKVEKDNTKKQVLQDAYNIKMAALISNQPAT